MEQTQPTPQSAQSLIEQAKDILIVTHESPTFDSIGSSLALYLGLFALGKKVSIACPEPITVELSSFVGVNKVISTIGKKNFVISLDYVEGSIEKVSYNIEGNKFNLVIEPRESLELFTPEHVHYSSTGTPADVIIVVDTIHLGGLKKLYESEKDIFSSKPIINIDRHPNNVQFGQINMVKASAASTAEIVLTFMDELGISLTEDIATNLLNAVYASTQTFTHPSTTAESLEVAARCMRAGGKRFKKSTPSQEDVNKKESVQSTPVIGTEQKPPPPASTRTDAPADWLKPKIFKSSSSS